MYNRKLNRLKSKLRNTKYALKSAWCGKVRGHHFTSEEYKGSYDGMGYFCDYCGAESDTGELVEEGRNVKVWNGVLKCETCKLETCEDFQDIQDVSGIDCGMCEDYERDYVKTILRPLVKIKRKLLLSTRLLNYLQNNDHWKLAEKFKWLLRRF